MPWYVVAANHIHHSRGAPYGIQVQARDAPVGDGREAHIGVQAAFRCGEVIDVDRGSADMGRCALVGNCLSRGAPGRWR